MTTYKHYETLGLNPDATPEEIKAAYRALAKQHHPDRNNNSPESVTKTQEINAAYEILSDLSKRASYDLHGDTASEVIELQGLVSAKVLTAFVNGRVAPLSSVRQETMSEIETAKTMARVVGEQQKKLTIARHRVKKYPAVWLDVMRKSRIELINRRRQLREVILQSNQILDCLTLFELEEAKVEVPAGFLEQLGGPRPKRSGSQPRRDNSSYPFPPFG